MLCLPRSAQQMSSQHVWDAVHNSLMHGLVVGTLDKPDRGALLFPLAAMDIIRECWAMTELR